MAGLPRVSAYGQVFPRRWLLDPALSPMGASYGYAQLQRGPEAGRRSRAGRVALPPFSGRGWSAGRRVGRKRLKTQSVEVVVDRKGRGELTFLFFFSFFLRGTTKISFFSFFRRGILFAC